MKLLIRAKIVVVNKVEKTTNGYSQTVVIEQPENKDEFGRVLAHAQIFLIHIWSKEVTAKMLDDSAIGEIRDFVLWLKGEKFTNDKGKVMYFLKLNLL